MAIVINGSGTVTGLAVGGLPDGTVDAGTLATNSVDSAELIDGSVDAVKLASGVGGKVLQVVSVTSATTFTTTSGTLVNTGINLAITPTLTSSKIMVIISASLGSSAGGRPAFGIRRDSTDLTLGTATGTQRAVYGGAYIGDTNATTTVSGTILDAPATTSATTYRITVSTRTSSYITTINRTNSDADNPHTVRPVSTITLMEIGV